MGDDSEARRRRAERLRRQIAGITGQAEDPVPPELGTAPSDTSQPPRRRGAPRVSVPSPREFVERRMRELDRNRGDKS